MVCQDEQMCAGLKAGINGTFQGVQAIWDKSSTMEDWEFLFMEANNALNEINRVGMLWTVQHLWPSGGRFVFNCYRHWSLLILLNENETASFLHIREGVTHRNRMTVIAYGIVVLTLIKNL